MPFFYHDGVSIFYTDEGSGQPALLVHGWNGDSHDWNFQIPVLLECGFRVVAMDSRGHGRSSAPQVSYSPFSMAEDMHALIHHLELGPSILLAHSLGSITASVLTAEHPEDVAALVLVQPIYFIDNPPVAGMIDQMRQSDAETIRQMVVTNSSKSMFTPRTPAWLKSWTLRRAAGGSPAAIIGSLEGLVEVAGKVTGPSDQAMTYLRRRHVVPRLVVCCIPAAEVFEKQLGLEDGRDECCFLNEGVYSHIAEADKFNSTMVEWLSKRGFAPTQ